jgi:hypothetical protein
MSGATGDVEVTIAEANSVQPRVWNMLDASAVSFELERQARLANSPSMTAWDGRSGVGVVRMLEQTAGTIDSIGSNPVGAGGYLAGRMLGLNNQGAAAMALVGSIGGDLVSLKTRPRSRPSWRQSELDVGNRLQPGSYRSQVSFKNGVEVPYGTKGSTRPDYFASGRNGSVEVKNYNVETALGRDRLVTNVTQQAIYRATHLPSGSSQTVYLDVRGQNVSRQQLNDMIDSMVKRSNGTLFHQDIMIMR